MSELELSRRSFLRLPARGASKPKEGKSISLEGANRFDVGFHLLTRRQVLKLLSSLPVGVRLLRRGDFIVDDTFISIAIEGPSEFIENTKEALALIKEKTEFYGKVQNYIGRIKEADFSGMMAYEDIPTFYTDEPTWQATTVWYASVIIHDAHHSELYHRAKKSLGEDSPALDTAWTGEAAEIECLEVQLKALIQLNADASIVNYVEQLIEQGPDYQDIPLEERDW